MGIYDDFEGPPRVAYMIEPIEGMEHTPNPFSQEDIDRVEDKLNAKIYKAWLEA